MDKFFIIAGNCLIENKKTLQETAKTLKTISKETGTEIILKGSYVKENRTRVNSSHAKLPPRDALQILKDIGEKYDLMTLTDVHDDISLYMVAGYVDIIQIPAFLCRQTGLLKESGKTNCIVNIKKGQFMSPEMMEWAVEKVRTGGKESGDKANQIVFLTERGTMFGYNDLVVDFRSIPIMKKIDDVKVLVDITHSLQKPNQPQGVTKGTWQYAEMMGKLAIAAGADGLYLETHPNPQKALSDKDTQIPLSELPGIIDRLIAFKFAHNQIY